MIEIFDTAPDVSVQEPEYVRLLGYPRGTALAGRALELADGARAWFAAHGRPWVYAREVARLDVAGEAFRLDHTPFSSPRLATTLHNAGAHAVIVAGVSAGPELEAHAQQLWREEKPDEYFFLEVLGSALVEHLVTMTGARLCAWAETEGMAVLPHYSPGYPEWDIAEQPRLLTLLQGGPPGRGLEVFDTGMLRPKKSLLAVFGVTRHVGRVQERAGLTPCENCSFSPCQYRRAPYRRAPEPSSPELAGSDPAHSARESTPSLDTRAMYSVNTRALQRWSGERLTLAPRADGSIEAVFRYEGTTCTNTGRPLHFRYEVVLGPREEGYPIQTQACRAADGDDGYTYMCRFLTHREAFVASIGADQPLRGRPLNDVLTWVRPPSSAGCYCEPESRLHKWGLVLETIHYALARLESA